MRTITKDIKGLLDDNKLLNELSRLTDVNPNIEYSDVTMKEVKEKFDFLSNFLLDVIDKGDLDEIPVNRRTTIYNVLKAIQTHSTNPQQVMMQVEALQDHMNLSGLFYKNIGGNDYESELKNLTKLKRRYTNDVKSFDVAKENLEFIESKREELEQLLEDAETTKEQIAELKDSSATVVSEIDGNLEDANKGLTKVNETEEDIEKKKLTITTFYENIEEYKSSIKTLEDQAKKIIGLGETIKNMVLNAEKALQLNSAVGISAAFSSYQASASNKKLYQAWVLGSVGFVGLAILLTVWIVGGWWITNPNEISSIIGRIVAVAIAISGATFCARQYVKQKNIAEDYAYKAILSKSIIAFTDEIKSRDKDKVADYLTKVLDEIHKDPLRIRDKKSAEGNGISEDTLKKILKYKEVAE